MQKETISYLRIDTSLKHVSQFHLGVEPKIGDFTPKMDGENNGKPYVQMDDLGVYTIIFGNIHLSFCLKPVLGGLPLISRRHLSHETSLSHNFQRRVLESELVIVKLNIFQLSFSKSCLCCFFCIYVTTF